jgi:ABC-type nitrate/sulfonate/bicarbonate transport system ATPase subunit
MIEISHISKQYLGTTKKALHGVSLSIPTESFTVFLGSSGCGKSTLFKIISGLETADSGKVAIEGKVAMVFQSGALLPWLSAYDNVAFALLNDDLTPKEKDFKIIQALEDVGLSDFKDKLPREISGGQRQRIGIARALVSDADVLLFDEPFSALDIATVYEMHGDLIDIWQRQKKTIILISHSLEEAILLGQTIYVFGAGEVKKVFNNPAPYPRKIEDSDQANLLKEVKQSLLSV